MFFMKMKIVLLISCLLALISASFAGDGNCDTAVQFLVNEAKREDPSIISYDLRNCSPQGQESYRIIMSYQLRDSVTGISSTRFCWAILVQLKPEEKDAPRGEVVRKGHCSQS